jgi:lipopolysaccharide transport system permease protein
MTAGPHARTATHILGTTAHLLSPWRSLHAFRDALLLLWRYRALCRELVHRELTGQYAGQALGSFWVVGHTVLTLAVYVFLFVAVLKVKIDIGPALPRDYTSYLFAGLVPWLAIAQALSRSTGALIAQANLVKQVVFPVEILPLCGVFVSLVPLGVGMAVLVAYQTLMGVGLPWTVIFVPIFVVGLFFFLGGIAFLLAAITPFFRDTKDFVTFFLVAGVYLVPAFYLPNWVPEIFKPIMHINPFSYPIWVSHDIFYYGRVEHPVAWIVFFALAFLFFSLGFRAFRSLKPYVSTVL